MSEPATPPVESVSIRDRVSKPAGLFPRHLQAWVMAGIAGLIMGVILFTGQPPARSAAAASKPPVTVDASQVRIQEYRDRLEEQVRRLQSEQADLAAAKQALAGVGRSGAGAPSEGSAPGLDAEATAAQEAIARDQAQRTYRALYADNLAWSSHAGDKSPAPTSDGKAPEAAGPASPAGLPSALAAALARVASATKSAETTVSGAEAAHLPPGSTSVAVHAAAPPAAAAGSSSVAASAGPTYPLLEGTYLDAVLTNRLDGAAAGPVNAMVTTPVYARDFQHVLIPRGSRVLGTASPVSQFGQTRLAVVFHRLIFPDGHSMSLDRLPAVNQRGDIGLRDQVDQHLFQVFGTSLAIGVLAGLAQVNTSVGLDESWTDAYRQGVGSSVTQSSMRILDRFLNQLPTVTIREGHRLKVYLTADLALPPYRDGPPEPETRDPRPSPSAREDGGR